MTVPAERNMWIICHPHCVLAPSILKPLIVSVSRYGTPKLVKKFLTIGRRNRRNKYVKPLDSGGRERNHCPYCLSSLHVDNEKGDRKSNCNGIMEAISVWVKRNGEWSIIHRCKICGKLNSNRIAFDDNSLKLISIAMKPISNIPFPI